MLDLLGFGSASHFFRDRQLKVCFEEAAEDSECMMSNMQLVVQSESSCKVCVEVNIMPEMILFLLKSSEILLEGAVNKLYVNGVDAPVAMNDVIKVTLPSVPEWVKVDNVDLTDKALKRINMGVASAKSLAPSSELDALILSLSKTFPGMSPEKVVTLLEVDSGTVLSGIIVDATVATNVQLVAIINISNESGSGEAGFVLPKNVVSKLVVTDVPNVAYWSVQDELMVGDFMYVDRPYTISNVSTDANIDLSNSEWIQVANSLKNYVGAEFIIFELEYKSDIYVAHRDDFVVKPSWLSGWPDTRSDLVNSEPTVYSLHSFQ